jgi:predicted Zn-dependent protease
MADLEGSEKKTLLTGSLVTAGIVGMKYSRRAESEADLLGAQYLWNAGWDPEGIARFFQVLEQKHGSSVPGWLSTHPTHERRIQDGIHWARAFLPPRERFLLSTAEFQKVKERVAALPPPRKRPTTNGRDLHQLMGETSAFRGVIRTHLPEILVER